MGVLSLKGQTIDAQWTKAGVSPGLSSSGGVLSDLTPPVASVSLAPPHPLLSKSGDLPPGKIQVDNQRELPGALLAGLLANSGTGGICR